MATLSGINSETELRELIGSPQELVVSKISNRLNDLTRQFVERSPFMCLATSAPDGSCDVSPRGDPAGFVRILDERTLLIPDRPGNRIADSLRNILANPHVGLLFLIPGIGDTFRVNGRATLVTDADLLAESTVEGREPKLGILVERGWLTPAQLERLLEHQQAGAPPVADGDSTPVVDVLRTPIAEAAAEPGATPGEPEADESGPGHVLFVWSAAGYALLVRAGEPPPLGSEVSVSGGRRVVSKIAPSPLPGDPRRCAFLDAP